MNKNSTRYFSNKQEKKVAKQVGGRKTANSGATMFSKGDVTISDLMLIECKTCVKEQRSFSIKKEWIEKNDEEKFAMGIENSALAFDFGDGEQHYIIDAKLFRRLVDFLQKEKEENL